MKRLTLALTLAALAAGTIAGPAVAATKPVCKTVTHRAGAKKCRKPAKKKAASPLRINVTVWDSINTNNEYETPKQGQRFIAVELGITNTSPNTVSSDADVDTTVIGTNGQTYTSALGDERAGCTDFDYGSFTLVPGGKETGCVVYELPEGVKAATVQFGLNLKVESKYSVEGL
jgi:hypothetical protein